jgi:hypothetical protein
LGRAVLAPKRRSRKAQIDQAVPFQDSTRVRTTPLLLAYSPVALHDLAETQDTP